MSRAGGWRTRACALALATAAALASCGSDDGSEPVTAGSSSQSPTDASSSATPSEEATTETAPSAPANAPDCADVWQEGLKVSRFYKGCVESGTYVPRDALGCSSGQRMVRYADHFYVFLGGTVYETADPLDEDDDYRAAVRRCRA